MAVVADVILAGTAAGKAAASASNDGYLYFETDTLLLKRSNASAWVQVAGSATYPDGVSALADAATITVDATLGSVFTVTLGGNRTLGNPTGAVSGQKMVFRVKQDATGSRTLAFDTKYRFGTDITGVTLTTTANKLDYIGVIYDAAADKFDIVSFVKGY